MEYDAGRLVRSARQRSRLTQKALAARSGVAQPNIAAIERHTKDAKVTTVERLLASAGEQLAALPTREATASYTGAHVAELLRRQLPGRAYRAVLSFHDGLLRSPPALRVALAVASPVPTGDSRWDALVAAVVEHDLEGLPLPSWIDEPERFTDGWYVDQGAPEAIRSTIRRRTPKAFRRHGVWLDRAELASV